MTNETKTTNGMTTNVSSLNKNVDLFFKIGASRGKDIITDFKMALDEDTDTAIRIAQWVRDVRGGSGERQLYKDILKFLASDNPTVGRKLIAKTPELGRWDDLLVLIGTPLEKDVLDAFQKAIVEDQNGLCAKWMPRKGDNAVAIRKHMEMSPKQYRKTIVGLTEVVETKMCAKDWESIEFGKLPSVASARYMTAFHKNAPELYKAYKAQLEKGEATINAGAVYPYDVIKALKNGDATVANAQWKALPDYMDGTTERVLPMIDVSGSMNCGVGGSASVTCMDVAVSLGLYISERNESIFKDSFLTFSEQPALVTLTGTLKQRNDAMRRTDWGFSTNLENAFNLVLDKAKEFNLDQSMMPTKVLILSDMQFDQTRRHGSGGDSAMDMITRQYEEAGYKIPDIVYWNLNASGGVPVEFDKQGTALISGLSPAIMKSVLACQDLTPVEVMKTTLKNDRYDWE